MHYVFSSKQVLIQCMSIKILLVVRLQHSGNIIENSFHLALHCAATCGHTSCIRLLVELYGCSLESTSEIIEDINKNMSSR